MKEKKNEATRCWILHASNDIMWKKIRSNLEHTHIKRDTNRESTKMRTRILKREVLFLMS